MSKLPLHLGQTLDGQPFTLPLSALERHFLALGGTGSGKTVLSKAVIEECIRYCLPCVAIDLQGDILTLAKQSGFVPDVPGVVHPSDVTRAKYAERLDFRVWTPGSDAGLPVSFAPNMAIPAGVSQTDRDRSIGEIARAICAMVGSKKEDVRLAIYTVIDYADQLGIPCDTIEDLAQLLDDSPEPLWQELQQLVTERVCDSTAKSLRLKLRGDNYVKYGLGQPIDVWELFGCRVPGPRFENPPRARLSVIYLAHLADDDKMAFLSLLFSAMYRWMLSQTEKPSGVLYMDEIAPFCPPVAKPPTKEGLMLLLRQARKYGLGCVLATQSPGDLDYKALGQIGTVALGKVTQRQDIGKVDAYLRTFPDVDVDAIMEALPGASKGRFVILNSDHLAAPTPIQARWLATEHGPVVPEHDISSLIR